MTGPATPERRLVRGLARGLAGRLWPRSLHGQVLLALALALLLAQAVSSVLLYRSQLERRNEALVHTVAFRLFLAVRRGPPGPSAMLPTPMPMPMFPEGRLAKAGDSGQPGPPRELGSDHGPPPGARLGPGGLGAFGPPGDDGLGGFGGPLRGPRPERVASFVPSAHDVPARETEEKLAEILTEQDISVAALHVYRRPLADDMPALGHLDRQRQALGNHAPPRPDHVLVAALQRTKGGDWLVVRILVPRPTPFLLVSLILQTLLIYGVLVTAMALVLKRITRPLAVLTARLERFAQTRAPEAPLPASGPDDLKRLIVAHNAMEARISALLDEKDVMLGAIGHDLKTPLAALRVRIESVEDDGERRRMAATIEDIVRTLDDILSLARVGRPTDPCEPTELSALVASIVEEYEDMGEPVELDETPRLVLPLRTTWLRRALRNLIGNALRYGGKARVSLAREPAGGGRGPGWAAIRIDDEGPGIAPDRIAAMLEPFTRGEPSRNSETGGAGLGLTLARAIAEQHGGSLTLANRRGGDGLVAGLTATLRLPLA